MTPEEIHRLLASITGQLSLAIVRRKLSKGALTQWAKTLRQVADVLDCKAHDAPSKE